MRCGHIILNIYGLLIHFYFKQYWQAHVSLGKNNQENMEFEQTSISRYSKRTMLQEEVKLKL